jgi:hypothetical protein
MAMSYAGNCRHTCKDDGLLVRNESMRGIPPCRAPLCVPTMQSPIGCFTMQTAGPNHWVSAPYRAPLGVPIMQSLTGCPHHADPHRVSPPCRTSLGVPAVQSPAGCPHHEEPHWCPHHAEPHWVSPPRRASEGVSTMQSPTGCPRCAEPCWVSSPCRAPLGVPTMQSPAGCPHNEKRSSNSKYLSSEKRYTKTCQDENLMSQYFKVFAITWLY